MKHYSALAQFSTICTIWHHSILFSTIQHYSARFSTIQHPLHYSELFSIFLFLNIFFTFMHCQYHAAPFSTIHMQYLALFSNIQHQKLSPALFSTMFHYLALRSSVQYLAALSPYTHPCGQGNFQKSRIQHSPSLEELLTEGPFQPSSSQKILKTKQHYSHPGHHVICLKPLAPSRERQIHDLPAEQC